MTSTRHPRCEFRNYDYVLLLDVIEHLNRSEVFFDRLRDAHEALHQYEIDHQHAERRLSHHTVDAALGAVQLRQTRHSRYDPYPSVYVFLAPAIAGATRVSDFQIARHPRAVSRRIGKQPAKPLPGRGKQIVSPAVSFIVFLPNARGGCTETIVRVTSAARYRRIFRTRKYTRIDADMTARGWIWATSSELYLRVTINPRLLRFCQQSEEIRLC